MGRIHVAAYIWPSYHHEPRLERFWPEGDGEWYTVRRGTSRFPGHDMPRYPLLGYQDEADPEVAAQHVQLAAEHAIDAFIMDWYWYDGAPCLERQLNDALIPAIEGSTSRFYLMWANHDVNDLWDMHTDEDGRTLYWTGKLDRAGLEPMFHRMVERYLSHPHYLCIDGKPVLSIFDPGNFIDGLGGLDAALGALEWMRETCVRAGLGGLHVQCIAVGRGAQLRPDSATSYQFVMDAPGEGDYVPWAAQATDQWAKHERDYGVYFPQVSLGWDDTHRHPGKRVAVTGSHPASFEACLWKAKQWVESRPNQYPLVTLNSWNEWTEGSALLPDLRWGYGYLRAVRQVFGP